MLITAFSRVQFGHAERDLVEVDLLTSLTECDSSSVRNFLDSRL
jgi:hypothetical protein